MDRRYYIKGIILSAVLAVCASCDEMRKQAGAGQDEVREIEFVKPVKESQPLDDDPDFTESSNGTPIEGKQSAPKDGLVRESTAEEDELWN